MRNLKTSHQYSGGGTAKCKESINLNPVGLLKFNLGYNNMVSSHIFQEIVQFAEYSKEHLAWEKEMCPSVTVKEGHVNEHGFWPILHPLARLTSLTTVPLLQLRCKLMHFYFLNIGWVDL